MGAPPSSSDFYLDVQSSSDLAGIPYFVEGPFKVSVGTFSETPGMPPVKDKRVAFAGLKPGGGEAYGWVTIAREFTGTIEFRATLSVKTPSGLGEGYRAGNLVMNFPPILKKGQSSEAHTYIGAAWDPGLQGFVLEGWDSNAPVGMPLVISNATEVDLRMTRSRGTIELAGRKTPPDPSDESGWQTVVTVQDPMPSSGCSLEFGAEWLAKGEQLFFDYFSVKGPSAGGEAETPAIDRLRAAIPFLDAARTLAQQSPADFEAAGAQLDLARAEIETAQSLIAGAKEEGLLQKGTRDKLAKNASERARKGAVKAKKDCDAASEKKLKIIDKTILATRDHCRVAIANLVGVNATNAKKISIGK